MTALDLNRRLATLLGWTNITETGGALLGTPPEGEPQCRGQACVPDWAGDDGEALRLAVNLRIYLIITGVCTYAEYRSSGAPAIKELNGNDRYAATRRAIARAAIATLEASVVRNP